LPPLEEFVLRSIGADLISSERISGLLGLDEVQVIAVLAELVTNDYVLPTGSEEGTTFSLTSIGRRALTELEELKPEQRVYPLTFDGLTRRFVRLGNVPMYSRSELRGEGIEEVPAFPNDPPDVDDLVIAEVAALLNEVVSPAEVRRDLIAVLGLEGNRRRTFQRAVALIYESLSGSEPVVEFAIDGRLSEPHTHAFATAEGVRKLGIMKSLRRTPDSVASTLVPANVIEQVAAEEEVAAIRQTSDSLRSRVEELQRRLKDGQEGPEGEAVKLDLNESTQRLAELEAALGQMAVRPLEVFEHPPLLRKAFEEASTRLLIVSPWIRAAVVDSVFLHSLEATLERGVQVYIGYGTGVDETATSRDRDAEASLLRLAAKHPNLIVGRLGDTHAKVLLVDDKYVVVTSFNWLSFRGDPNMPYRDERGMLVALPATIETVFAGFELRIRDSAADAHASTS
jgi:hypothetical protein